MYVLYEHFPTLQLNINASFSVPQRFLLPPDSLLQRYILFALGDWGEKCLVVSFQEFFLLYHLKEADG